MLADWNRFYDGYDPVLSWWTSEPFGRLDKALTAYAEALRLHLAGIKPGEPAPIIGDPVQVDGLRADLAFEMIPYAPEELIAIGSKEFDWIEAEFKKVSRDMGFGDDWKKALEHVKTLAPPPGEVPWVIFDIAEYSRASSRTCTPSRFRRWPRKSGGCRCRRRSGSGSTRSSTAARSRASRIRPTRCRTTTSR